MIIDLIETKTWLRVDGADEDTLIQTLISAAETYLLNATGNKFDNTYSLAKLLCLVLVAEWYENRQALGRMTDRIRPTVESMVAQLAHSYDLNAPAKPTVLKALVGSGFVDLSWTANTESDLAGYNIYQDSVKITASLVTGTTYQVTGLTNGVAYTFQVSAVDKSGNESALSDSVSATPT